MKSNKNRRENEVLEMFSASKLVNDLMRRDGLTPNLMMKKSGMPEEYIVAILEGKVRITEGNALLFERCFGWPARDLLCQQALDDIAMLKALAEIMRNELEFFKTAAEMRQVIARTEKRLCRRAGLISS
jgi:plasmid maintenance system antidote protein VapI